MNITSEVLTLQKAIKHLRKVQDREVWSNTSMPETQYALVLVLLNILDKITRKVND